MKYEATALAGSRAGQLLGIDHVAILVKDIDESLGDFVDGLGLQLVSDETLHDPPVRLAHLDAGNVDLQLVQPLGPGKLADDLQRVGPGLHHVCFGVPSLDAALESLSEPSSASFIGGRGRRACFLSRRPSQLYLELIEFADGPAYGTLATATERVLAYWADECRRDMASMLAHFTPDAEVLTPGGSYTGTAAIAELYQESFTAYPELVVDVTAHFVGRGAHCYEFDATLTDKDGALWGVRGVNVVTLENGLIARMRSYEDLPGRLS